MVSTWNASGYMAPEYIMHGRLSVKADVFSFGVVVLELISGKKNSTFDQEDCPNLLEWVRTDHNSTYFVVNVIRDFGLILIELRMNSK